MTVCTQVEALINGRPLSANSDDIRDLEALTPNHFLIGRPDATVPVVVVDDLKICLRKRWRQTQELSAQFWNRWQKEYLPSLTKRSKWYDENDGIKIGANICGNFYPSHLINDSKKKKESLERNIAIKWNLGESVNISSIMQGKMIFAKPKD